MCPNWLIMLLLVLLCGYSGKRTLSKGFQQCAAALEPQTRAPSPTPTKPPTQPPTQPPSTNPQPQRPEPQAPSPTRPEPRAGGRRRAANLDLTLTPALTLALTLARWAKESRAQSSGEYAAVGQQEGGEGAELRGGVVVGGDGDSFDSGGVGHAAELQAAP